MIIFKQLTIINKVEDRSSKKVPSSKINDLFNQHMNNATSQIVIIVFFFVLWHKCQMYDVHKNKTNTYSSISKYE